MPEMEQIPFFQSTAQFVFFQPGSGSTETLLIHKMKLIDQQYSRCLESYCPETGIG